MRNGQMNVSAFAMCISVSVLLISCGSSNWGGEKSVPPTSAPTGQAAIGSGADGSHVQQMLAGSIRTEMCSKPQVGNVALGVQDKCSCLRRKHLYIGVL